MHLSSLLILLYAALSFLAGCILPKKLAVNQQLLQ